MKTLILDLEADGLENQKRIHCAVTLDYGTGEQKDWIDVHKNIPEFNKYCDGYTYLVGHNMLGFDWPLLNRFGFKGDYRSVIDTLVLSQLTNFPRELGHSLESYGEEAHVEKVGSDILDWSVYSPIMLDRCRSDVRITKYLLDKFMPYITSPRWQAAIRTEHDIAWYCNDLHDNGFAFDVPGARTLRSKIDEEVKTLEAEFAKIFPPRSRLIREITPRVTRTGTLHKGDFRWAGNDLSEYAPGQTFSLIEYEEFNPGSTKQRIDRLWEAKWAPTEKTKGYKEFLRSLPRRESKNRKLSPEQETKKAHFERYGWTCSEENLSTLPETAPRSIQSLVRWLLLSSRVRRLDEWLGVVRDDNRIHGRFRAIGAWTHRMAHTQPNMGNIPKFDAKQPDKTPYSDQMRELWVAGEGKYLVGVDAESIQLRVLAHYLEDEEFTHAIVAGKKEDKTDPHSVNQRAIGVFCRSRDDAKTFIYAWLLGAGLGKIAEILKCSTREAAIANDNFLLRYSRLKSLKEEVIPNDAVRGWFAGFDGRCVRIPGSDVSTRTHLALAGYLQSGESIIMKRATQIWYPELTAKKIPFKLVNWVHDEWQLEVPKDMELAKLVAQTVADSIGQAGLDLGLRCPMLGSIMSSHGGLAIGDNWYQTH